jgi:hypothetical protein
MLGPATVLEQSGHQVVGKTLDTVENDPKRTVGHVY